MAVDKAQPVFVTVDSLRPDQKGVNLNLKVLESKVVMTKPPRGPKGQPLVVAECLVGDQTGSIIMTARNEQVDICKPGAYVTLRNAKIDMYRGSMRLAADKWSKLEGTDGSFDVKVDNNMSLIEYELVTIQ